MTDTDTSDTDLIPQAPAATPVSPMASSVVALEPVTLDNFADLLELDWDRAARPELGGWVRRLPPESPMGLLLLRQQVSGAVVGAMESRSLTGYPGVVNTTIFVDPGRVTGSRFARAAVAMHAYALHCDLQFAQGARLVHHEVLEITTVVHSLLKRIGIRPEARMRDHCYIAGRWWDVLVYAFDAERWAEARREGIDRHFAFIDKMVEAHPST